MDALRPRLFDTNRPKSSNTMVIVAKVKRRENEPYVLKGRKRAEAEAEVEDAAGALYWITRR